MAAPASLDLSAEAARLQGTWEVVSARRDGRVLPSHVGARVMFGDHEVKLVAKAPIAEISDGTS
jgi:hypothetical protein